MLVYCNYSLLKDENTDEVNCEADFHFQAFHQKCTIYEYFKVCAIPTAVVYVLPTSCSPFQWRVVLCSNHSTFISMTLYLPVAFYLQASRMHLYTYVTHKSLVCYSRVAHNDSRIAWELHRNQSWFVCESLASTCYLDTELYRILPAKYVTGFGKTRHLRTKINI